MIDKEELDALSHEWQIVGEQSVSESMSGFTQNDP